MNILELYPSLEMTKEVYTRWLLIYNMSVTFTKVDGTERVMKCTLRKSQLPINNQEKSEKTPKTDSVVVWDLEKKAWRQFKIASVTEFCIEENNLWTEKQ